MYKYKIDRVDFLMSKWTGLDSLIPKWTGLDWTGLSNSYVDWTGLDSSWTPFAFLAEVRWSPPESEWKGWGREKYWGKAKYDFSDLEKWLKLEGTLNGNVEREVRTGDSGEGAGKKKKKKKKPDSVSPFKK